MAGDPSQTWHLASSPATGCSTTMLQTARAADPF